MNDEFKFKLGKDRLKVLLSKKPVAGNQPSDDAVQPREDSNFRPQIVAENLIPRKSKNYTRIFDIGQFKEGSDFPITIPAVISGGNPQLFTRANLDSIENFIFNHPFDIWEDVWKELKRGENADQVGLVIYYGQQLDPIETNFFKKARLVDDNPNFTDEGMKINSDKVRINGASCLGFDLDSDEFFVTAERNSAAERIDNFKISGRCRLFLLPKWYYRTAFNQPSHLEYTIYAGYGVLSRLVFRPVTETLRFNNQNVSIPISMFEAGTQIFASDDTTYSIILEGDVAGIGTHVNYQFAKRISNLFAGYYQTTYQTPSGSGSASNYPERDSIGEYHFFDVESNYHYFYNNTAGQTTEGQLHNITGPVLRAVIEKNNEWYYIWSETYQWNQTSLWFNFNFDETRGGGGQPNLPPAPVVSLVSYQEGVIQPGIVAHYRKVGAFLTTDHNFAAKFQIQVSKQADFSSLYYNNTFDRPILWNNEILAPRVYSCSGQNDPLGYSYYEYYFAPASSNYARVRYFDTYTGLWSMWGAITINYPGDYTVPPSPGPFNYAPAGCW